ncbi:MAG: alpha/beta fold hydrolase [Oligoflexales bacterium]
MSYEKANPALSKLIIFFILLPGFAGAEPSHTSLSLSNGSHEIFTELYADNSGKKTSEVVLYITGQGDAISMYEYLVNDFIDKFGRDIFLYDVRGQGRSSGARCHIDDYKDHLADLEIVIKHIMKYYEKIHIVAHSTGALIASLYVLEGLESSAIKSLSLISPFFGLAGPSIYRKFAGFASRFGASSLGLGQTQVLPFNPAVYVSTRKNNLLTHDPEFYEKFNGHPEKCGTPTYSWIQASISAQKRLKELKRKVSIPFLMLTAGEDGVVSTENAKQQCAIWNEVNQVSCTYHEYEGMRHGLIYEIKEVREDLYHKIGEISLNSSLK